MHISCAIFKIAILATYTIALAMHILVIITFLYLSLIWINMKCELCNKNVEELFLKKIKGTYVKDAKGKKHVICFECQKKLNDKKKILEKLNASVA